jgi:hypothetical protein
MADGAASNEAGRRMSVDQRTVNSVALRDSSTSAQVAPLSAANRDEGPLSSGGPIACAECGHLVGGTAADVRLLPCTRSSYTELRPGEHGAWCHRCKRLTVYIVEAA